MYLVQRKVAGGVVTYLYHRLWWVYSVTEILANLSLGWLPDECRQVCLHILFAVKFGKQCSVCALGFFSLLLSFAAFN